KDKLFIFGDYEGIRYVRGIPTSISVPSDNARKGILARCPDNTSTGCTPLPCTPNSTLLDPNANICVDNSVAQYLPFWPHATFTPAGSDTGTFGFSAQRRVTENFFTIRGDYKISDKDSLAATYLRDGTPYSFPQNLVAG